MIAHGCRRIPVGDAEIMEIGILIQGGLFVSKQSTYGGLILILVVVMVLVGVFRQAPVVNPVTRYGTDKIAVIYIEGVIAGGRSGSSILGTVVGSDDVINLISQARKDPQVKAVVIRINSPGGSAAASEEIGTEVKKLRDAGKTVVASMGDVAASGGYWIAAHADWIVANAATTTGSIGVITQLSNYEGLYEKLGIDSIVIKSGTFKDMGSDSRQPTTAEIALFQTMVDDIYAQFVQVVAQGRDMDEAAVKALADGRVLTGKQALDAGLVDEIGNFNAAIDVAADRAGIEGTYYLEDYRSYSFWDIFKLQADSMMGWGKNAERSLLNHLLLIYDGGMMR
jgi:protease-4